MNTEEILRKVDGMFSQNQGAMAQELLETSIRLAMEEGDDAALLTLLNELIGYLRETSQVESSYRYAQAALSLTERMGIEGSIAHATTLLNVANAYRAGGRLEDSLSCYRQAEAVYDKVLEKNDMLRASLANNISLLYQEMGDFEAAYESLWQALAIVKENEDTAFEEAVTYANLAATCLRLNRDSEAQSFFEQSIRLFEENEIRDAHYSAALSSMGTFFYKKKEYGRAAECFEKAMAGMKASLGENEYYHRLAENLEACRRARESAGESADAQPGDMQSGDAQPDGGQSGVGQGSGLALCRAYFEAFGRPMLEREFPEEAGRITAGLVGEGSDCFGFDDEVSRDHDWGPGFCLWVSEEDYQRFGKRLQEAYERLPRQFRGYTRRESAQGRGRMGVRTVPGFYRSILGDSVRNLTERFSAADVDWARADDAALAAAVNGEVFLEGENAFLTIRRVLREGFPETVRWSKIAEGCARFSQAAQYNFARMEGRGDLVAAQLSLAEGMRQAMKLLYYLEGEYPPHDKWLFRGLSGREDFREACGLIRKLLESSGKAAEEDPGKAELAELLAKALADQLYRRDLVTMREDYLDFYAPELVAKSVLAQKTDEELIREIAEAEFAAFDRVRNTGGRAFCQNDWPTFSIMRRSQYMTWSRKLLLQYLYEFRAELGRGRNLVEEKYGRMMESNYPEEYEKIRDRFPALSPEKKQIVEAIVQLQVGFMEEFAARYPHLAGNARLIHTSEDVFGDTSYETYLRGEISTYSDKLLEMYGRFVAELAGSGQNPAERIMENTVHLYGYADLEAAEQAQRAAQI